MKLRIFLALAAGLTVVALPTGRASAMGGGNVEFSVSGTLPKFPCPTGCSATFSGSGTGAGETEAVVGDNTYLATYTIEAAQVTGTANYTEPGTPFCPLVGSAASPSTGSVTLSFGVTNGIVSRTGTPTFTGTVTGVSVTLSYTYERAGATAVLTITGGSMTVGYYFPDTGAGTFTQALEDGAGGGLFNVDPVQAASLCQNPGPLSFSLDGDAVVVAS